jgi:lipid-A-disaccharide synthase
MAGPKMRAAGCEPIADIEELSVMGLAEVLRKYPQLRRLRNRISDYYISTRPDVFVGIDVPDFVLSIEARLHAKSISTVHYVAPQVWAWRQSRAKRIAQHLDTLLALFPFEAQFYERYGLNTVFVGHPIADQIPLARDSVARKADLGLEQSKRYIALMPGSRRQEWFRHVDLFLRTAERISNEVGQVAFVVGAINSAAKDYISQRVAEICPGLEVLIFTGRAHEILGASDVALVASGTVTMEGLFTKTPMVVAYKVAPVTYFLMRRLVKVPFIAMPNILMGRALLPEFLQNEATEERLASSVMGWLRNERAVREFEATCTNFHLTLRQGAASSAAEEILRLAGELVE